MERARDVSRSHRDFRNREAGSRDALDLFFDGGRSHRDFRNREAVYFNGDSVYTDVAAVTATSGIVRRNSGLDVARVDPAAVTATSGIVRRLFCAGRRKSQSGRSHRDFRNREAVFFILVLGAPAPCRSHRDFRNREAVQHELFSGAHVRPQSPRLQES